MAETVKVPGDGTVSRKWVLIGGAVVAGIVGVAYLRRARTPAGPTTPDEAALAPTELPPADVAGTETGGGTTSSGLKFITTDAEWTADVLAKMGDLNFDTNAISVAIGKWLNGQPISQQEEQWIFAAIALGGMPPSGSHPIRLEPTPTSGSKPPRAPRPFTAETANWQGHRVTSRGVTLSSLASQFAHSKTPVGIASTLNAIRGRPENRSVTDRYGSLRPLPVGTVVLVPVWR